MFMRGVWLTRLLLLLFLSSTVYGFAASSLDTTKSTQGLLTGEEEDTGPELAEAEQESDESTDAAPLREGAEAEHNDQPSTSPSRSKWFISGGLGGLFLLLTSGFLFEFMKVVLLLALVAPMVARRQRHREDELTRGRILGYIEANTGIHFSALRDGLGLANGVTAYHTNNLERDGAIISWKSGKHRRYAASFVSPDERDRFQNPLSGTRLAILELLAEKGHIGTESKEIREKLAISRQLLSHHINELNTTNLIEHDERKGKKAWRASAHGMEQLRVSRTLEKSA